MEFKLRKERLLILFNWLTRTLSATGNNDIGLTLILIMCKAIHCHVQISV